jgi:ribonucleotide reductase beta subunit family protein with ferritin-like domain
MDIQLTGLYKQKDSWIQIKIQMLRDKNLYEILQTQP